MTTCSGALNFATPLLCSSASRLATSGLGCTRGHDHRTCPLSGAVVGQADDRDFGDAGVVGEQVLDFLGRDVLAVADDDVLGPAGHDEVVVIDPAPEISGAEKPCGIE